MIAGVEEIFGLMTVAGCGIFFYFYFFELLRPWSCLFFWVLTMDDVLGLASREGDGMLNLRKWASVFYYLFGGS